MSETTRMLDASMEERRAAIRGNDQTSWLARMMEIRSVEDRTLRLFSDGHVTGSTHTCQGQEAVSVGVAHVLRTSDTVACTYRGHGHALALGVTPRQVLGEIAGRTIGTTGGIGGSMHLSSPEMGLLPTFPIIGGGIPVAVGVGLAAQVKGTDDVGIALFGDGAANIGAFHEGLNLAAIWRTPTVFIIENNLYGEYSPLSLTTPIENLADRASSYGMPGVIVDGQDVFAVIEAVEEAVARARIGDGPTLLEMKTYRYSGHSRSDPATYRAEGELVKWQERDPITLLADHLIESGDLDAAGLSDMRAEFDTDVDAIALAVLDAPWPDRSEILANITQ